MPTRAQFLANGLVSVANTDHDCDICLDKTTDPVQLPCNHVFCKECIRTWLSQEGRNTCPSCRRVLFFLPPRLGQFHLSDRVSQVYQAAAQVNANNIVNLPITNLLADLFRANSAARAYLSFFQRPNNFPRSATFTLDIQFLQPYIVAMSDLLPALAAVNGRPYTPYQLAHWDAIVFRVWMLLSQPQLFRTITFVYSVRNAVRSRLGLSGHDVNRFAAFDSTQGMRNTPYGDLDTLLDFLASVALSEQDLRESRERAEERRRAEGQEACNVM